MDRRALPPGRGFGRGFGRWVRHDFFALRSTAGEGVLDKPFPQDEARLHDLFTGPAAARAGADFPALEQVLPGTVLTRSPVLEQAPGAPGWAPGRGNVLPGVRNHSRKTC